MDGEPRTSSSQSLSFVVLIINLSGFYVVLGSPCAVDVTLNYKYSLVDFVYPVLLE